MIAKARIMIVEDEGIVAIDLEEELSVLGYDVFSIVSSGEDAVEMAGKLRPDLILMDIVLEGCLDGVEAAEKIHASYDIPVIYLTAHADDATLKRAKATGPFGYIIKPCDRKTIQSTIEMGLHKYQMEKRLRESEARYRAIVEDQTELICRFNADLVLTFVNDACCRYFNRAREDLLDCSFLQLIPENDHPTVRLQISSLSPENPSVSHEHRALLKGAMMWHHWTDRAIFDEQGRIIEYQSIGRDITGQKEMELAIRASEERYRDIFENAHDLIQSVSPDGRFKYVNRAWRDALGYFEEEIENLNLLDIIHPDCIEHCMDLFGQVLSGDDVDDIKAAFITKDGRKILVEGSSTCKFADGKPVYTREIFRDVTDHKRSEEQILAQRDLATALVTATSLDEALKACLDAAIKVSGMDCGGIYLMDRSRDLKLAYSYGLSGDFLDRTSICKAGSDRWCMVVSGRPVYSRYDDLGVSTPADKQCEGLRALAMIPIFHRGRAIGCFNIASHVLDVVPAFSRNALEAITAQVGNAIARLQAEEALHEVQDELQSIFDSMQDFLFVLDSDGRILLANREVTKRLGYDEGGLKGMNALELHPPECRDEAASIIAEMVAGKRDLCPIPLLARDGTRIPVETKVTVERWGERDVVIGISRDISERLRIEDAMRKSEARYRAIVEDQTELICRFMPKGTLTFVNEAYCRYFGRSGDELIGTRFTPPIPEEDQRTIIEHHSSICKDQPVTTYDHRVMVPGGMRWIQWTARGIFDQAGRLAEYQAVGRDITDKKNIEQALLASEEHFRTLALSTPAGIFRADSQGRCTYVNNRWCEITGRDQSDAMGHDWKRYIFSEDLDRVDNAMQQLVLDDLPFKIEFRVSRPDKTMAWALVQIMVERNASGEVAGYVGTYTDITYLMQLEDELYKANQVLEQRIEERTEKLARASANLARAYQDLMAELSERKRSEEIRERLVNELEVKNAEMEKFVYTVSHDLRSPLITVGGFIGLLKSDLSKEKMDHVDADLNVISMAVSKMDTLLLDTLELSRIGRVANAPDTVSFEDMVMDALSQVEETIRTRGIEINVAPGMPQVNVDCMRIVEVLVNLIDNSIKYMGDQPHPEIEIGFRKSDSAFFIKDNGMGIDKSQYDKVFELFYKVDRKSDGPGAGLAIVKRIVEVHGGRIWVESELGKFCRICLTLPMP